MRKIPDACALVVAFLLAGTAVAQNLPRFHPGAQIKFDNGATLLPGGNNYTVAPCVVDYNGDGLLDLMAGYFYYGSVYVYPNIGSAEAPAFASSGFQQIQAGGQAISVGYS